MVLKSLKKDPPVLFDGLFYNETVFQKFECRFFDQVIIEAKNV